MEGWQSIFKAGKGTWSAKRFFGGLGLTVVHACYAYKCITTGDTSDTAILAGIDASLLGVEAVVNSLNKKSYEADERTTTGGDALP